MACASLQHLLPDVTPPTRLWYDVSDIAALREGELARSQATLVRAQAVASFVTAGYTRDSAVKAAESGDLSQLVPDPAGAARGGVRPGVGDVDEPGREAAAGRASAGPAGGGGEEPAKREARRVLSDAAGTERKREGITDG